MPMNEIKEQMLIRFEEVMLRLEVISNLRFSLLMIYPNASVDNHSKYIEANEMLSEEEKRLWQFIMGESDTY